MIEIIGTELNQWDKGRSVKVTVTGATHVHFANQGDSRAVIVELKDGVAKIPDYLLQTGKQLCVYAVAVSAVENRVTLEKKMFSVRKRECPEDYIYDDDQRNFVYELVKDAQEATETANQATKNANEAADKANQAAKSWVIMGEVRGESVVIDDAIDQTFAGFRIFGKTTQTGTPTPDAPVDMVSVENPTIAVNEQSMLVPYTLRGIPVSSGGNYIDSNGQQWVCDEVDFARGVYVKRVGVYSMNGGADAKAITVLGESVRWVHFIDWHGQEYVYGHTNGFFSHGKYLHSYSLDSPHAYVYNEGIYVFMPTELVGKTSETICEYEAAQYAAGTPLTVAYPLAEPIETHLSEEELAAYAALHTYREPTTVSNDAGAYMELEYVMDAKKYIDSLFTGGILPATVE